MSEGVSERVSESVSIDGGFAAGACGMAKRLRQEKILRVHTEDNNIFTMHRALHVLPKCMRKRFYPSAHRGNATAQVRALMLLALYAM